MKRCGSTRVLHSADATNFNLPDAPRSLKMPTRWPTGLLDDHFARRLPFALQVCRAHVRPRAPGYPGRFANTTEESSCFHLSAP